MIFAQALVCRHLGRGESPRGQLRSRGGRAGQGDITVTLLAFRDFFVTASKFSLIKDSGSEDTHKRLCFRSDF